MPIYDFRCHACGVSREVMTDHDHSLSLELVCASCGGDMVVIPSTFHLLRGAKEDNSISFPNPTKTCGHVYHCRCHIKLKQPNPFKREIRAAHGIVEED